MDASAVNPGMFISVTSFPTFPIHQTPWDKAILPIAIWRAPSPLYACLEFPRPTSLVEAMKAVDHIKHTAGSGARKASEWIIPPMLAKTRETKSTIEVS
jgi:hypothetical protein